MKIPLHDDVLYFEMENWDVEKEMAFSIIQPDFDMGPKFYMLWASRQNTLSSTFYKGHLVVAAFFYELLYSRSVLDDDVISAATKNVSPEEIVDGINFLLKNDPEVKNVSLSPRQRQNVNFFLSSNILQNNENMPFHLLGQQILRHQLS